MDEFYPITGADGRDEWQGSDAHIARGEGAAFDVRVPVGVATRCIFPWGEPDRIYWYGVNPNPCGGQFDYWGRVPHGVSLRNVQAGDEVHVRYCHLRGRDGTFWPITGSTGTPPTAPHLHVKIWVNDVEKRFEDLDWSRDIYAV